MNPNLDVTDRITLPRLLGIVIALAAWFVVASIFPRNLMPFPFETLESTWQLFLDGTVGKHLGATVWRTLWGFLGSLLLAIMVGVPLGLNRYAQHFLTPAVLIALSVPAIAWAAMTTIIFGFSLLAPVGATVLTVFPYLAIHIWKGVENIDTDLISMSKSFHVSNGRLLRSMILPSVAPALFAATRMGLALSWRIVTIAEIFASSEGIGYKILQSFSAYRFTEVWAWVVVFVIVILVIEYGILRPIEKRAFEYRADADFTVIG